MTMAGRIADSDWELIIKVHLNGAYSVTKAAWPYLLRGINLP